MTLATASMTQILDIVGIFVFAVSGALVGVRRGFNVIGMLILAECTALGGGVVRDVIIGATPPAAFVETSYLLTPILAGSLTFFWHRHIHRLNAAMLVFDAGGLGLFCVAGTLKALAYGLGPVQAVALGVTTAIGGGIVRDMMANEIPTILRPDSELYTTPALIASTLIATDWMLGGGGPLMAWLAVLVGCALRLASLHYGWRVPSVWSIVPPASAARHPDASPREIAPPQQAERSDRVAS